MSEAPNPYEAPVNLEGSESIDLYQVEAPREYVLRRSFLKWLLICAVCAAPSFFWGFMIGEMSVTSAVGMTFGILTFVAGYTFIESTEFVRRRFADRVMRRAVKISYGTRIGISVIFPVGMYLDVLAGMFSVMLTNGFEDGPPIGADAPMSVLWFYGTTLVQGIVLNVMLFVYFAIVYAICLAVMKRQPVRHESMVQADLLNKPPPAEGGDFLS